MAFLTGCLLSFLHACRSSAKTCCVLWIETDREGVDILPMGKPRDSSPHDEGFLLHWRLPRQREFFVLVLHRLHRHIAFRKPCGSFSVLELHRLHGSRNRQVKKERCTVVKHGSVFTRGTELPRNLQALFRCQCTRTSIPGVSRLSLNIQQLSTASLWAVILSSP